MKGVKSCQFIHLSVCSLCCLEGTLWCPGKEKCWIFPWIKKDTFKGKSLQHLQEYSRSWWLHLSQGTSGQLASGKDPRAFLNSLCRSEQQPLPCRKAEQPPGTAQESFHHQGAALGTSVPSGTSHFCMKDQQRDKKTESTPAKLF